MAADDEIRKTVEDIRTQSAEFTARTPDFATLQKRVADRKKETVSLRIFFLPRLAWGGLAAAVVAMVLLVGVKPGGHPSDMLTAKGEARMDVRIKRQNELISYADGYRAQPGDSLQFVLTAAAPVHYALYAPDGNDDIKRIFPREDETAQGGSPGGMSVPVSLVTDGSGLPDRIYGITAGEPFTAADARQELKGKNRAGKGLQVREFIIQ